MQLELNARAGDLLSWSGDQADCRFLHNQLLAEIRQSLVEQHPDPTSLHNLTIQICNAPTRVLL